MNGNSDIPLYLLAKAPIPGQVKTRMQPYLSPQQSAQLAEIMLEQSMAKLSSGWPGRRILSVAPDLSYPLFHELAERYGFSIQVQVCGDLGGRMAHCIQQGLKQSRGCAVFGADVPYVSESILSSFYDSMLQGENVVGPAEDGGFYLLGLQFFPNELFKNIKWGGENVLAKLLKNAQTSHLRLHEYQVLRDIDNWNDLCWLAETDKIYKTFVS